MDTLMLTFDFLLLFAVAMNIIAAVDSVAEGFVASLARPGGTSQGLAVWFRS
jgi:hypothetical protein